jgi:drug/metabolite transporter (DMT)-like permease
MLLDTSNTSRKAEPKSAYTYGMVVLMTVFWSLNYIAAKIALRSFPPILYACIRMILAGALMFAIYLVWVRKQRQAAISKWPWRDLLILSAIGVLGMVGNQILFVAGLGLTSVAHASLVIATTPVLVLLLAWMRGQEQLSRLKIAGMAMAIGGIGVLNLAPGRSARGASVLGDLLIFLCALSFAFYSVLGKERMRKFGAIPVNALGFGISALLLLGPVSLWGREFDYAAVPAMGWWMLAYMAGIASVLCYIIYSTALEHLPASRVASFSYAQPFIASLAAWWLLGEPVTLPVAMGGLMVLGGVWLTGRRGLTEGLGN